MATQYIQEDPNMVAQTLLQGLTGAIQAQADRPIKTSATTTTTSKPLEYSDLLARRNQIGAERAMLNEALKQRETFGYGLANALASMPAQQGAGSWLGDFARGLGSAFNARANAAIDRAKQDYESAQADLATALAFDKAMGDRQIQSEEIGYTPLPMGGSGSGSNRGTVGSQSKGVAIPITSEPDWNYWISNWDEERPTESAYRSQSGLGRALENMGIGKLTGSANESAARESFKNFKDTQVLPMVRETLKGAGPITDFEDKKYSGWVMRADDPVKLKDVMVDIVMNEANKNGWTDEQKLLVLDKLGLQSFEDQLTPEQAKQNPLRVKQQPTTIQQTATQQQSGIDDILNKYGAKRVQ